MAPNIVFSTSQDFGVLPPTNGLGTVAGGTAETSRLTSTSLIASTRAAPTVTARLSTSSSEQRSRTKSQPASTSEAHTSATVTTPPIRSESLSLTAPSQTTSTPLIAHTATTIKSTRPSVPAYPGKPSSSNNHRDSDGITSGAAVAISVSITLAVLAFVYGIWYFIRWRNRKRRSLMPNFSPLGSSYESAVRMGTLSPSSHSQQRLSPSASISLDAWLAQHYPWTTPASSVLSPGSSRRSAVDNVSTSTPGPTIPHVTEDNSHRGDVESHASTRSAAQGEAATSSAGSNPQQTLSWAPETTHHEGDVFDKRWYW